MIPFTPVSFTPVSFTKMHGAGNDFILIEDLDDAITVEPDFVRSLCDRHFGIGSDGFIRITRGTDAPFFMDYWNPDGSLAEMCGNGIRTMGKWLGDRNYASEAVDIETRGGTKRLQLFRTDGAVTAVRVDMGAPDFGDISEMLGDYEISFVITAGTPHAVIFVDDVETAPLEVIGPWVQSQTLRFPEGVNVEVANVAPDGIIDERTYERGAGETLACGTGACAVAVAAQRRGLAGQRVVMNVRGGELTLEWTPGESVFLTGPAIEVFSGEISI